MNKKLLAEKLSATLNLDKKTGLATVDAVFSLITEELAAGNVVDISGFGKFDVRERASRPGFNPRTKETITIPASKSPGFKAAKALKDAIK